MSLNFFFVKFLALILTIYQGVNASFPIEGSNDLTVTWQESTITPMQLFQNPDEDNHGRMLVYQTPEYYRVSNRVFLEELTPMFVALSRDSNTAFVIQFPTGLFIYDISDWANPKMISNYKLLVSDPISAFLSPKNTILAVRLNRTIIQIFNVTDLKNPTLTSQIELSPGQEYSANPSLAISSDDKFIISTDPTFSIFDISDVVSPQLIYSLPGRLTTTVVLSADDKTAYIGSLRSISIWNLTDLKNPTIKSLINVQGLVLTATLSENQKTLYFLGAVDFTIWIHVVNLTNLTSIKVRNAPWKTIHDQAWMSLTASSDDTLLAWRNKTDLWVLSVPEFRDYPVLSNPLAISFPTVAFLPNSKKALYFQRGMMQQIEFHSFIFPEKSSSMSPNYVAQFPLPGGFIPKHIALTPSNKRALILAQDPLDSMQKMILDIDLSSFTNPKITQTTNKFKSSTYFLTLSSDGKTLYYKSGGGGFLVYSLEGEKFSLVAYLGSKTMDLESMFVVSSDKTAQYLFFKNYTKDITENHDIIFKQDISTPDTPKLLVQTFVPSLGLETMFVPSGTFLALSPDDKTLFLLDYFLYIYDVSGVEFVLLSRLSLFEFIDVSTKTFAFSSDYKTCFVLASPLMTKPSLIAVDIRNFSNPAVLSKIDLPVDTNPQLQVSSDDNFVFASTPGAFITVNVSNPTSMKISDVQLLKVSTFTSILNDQYALIGNANGLQILNRKPSYSLLLNSHEFKLGKTYTNWLKILQLNQFNSYSRIEKNWKFTHASLCQIDIDPLDSLAISYAILPNWISLNKDKFTLDLDLTLSQNPASYKIRFRVSTQVSRNAFLAIKDANFSQDDLQNLQVHLVTLGHLDSEQFLTSDFNENVPLLLSTQYSPYESEIRNILKSYSIDLLTTISIQPSLELLLLKTGSFQISTLSTSPVQVAIQLNHSKQAQFLTQAFSAIKVHLDETRTLLFLEGALLNINEALRTLLIDVKEDGASCEGVITISDNLNPTLQRHFHGISDHIGTNKRPKMNESLSVQGQVDAVWVAVGEHFIIEFDEKTFYDLNNRSLTYSLGIPGKAAAEPEWITMRGRSLTGTPPEKLLPYKVQFVIIASNEYKSIPVEFTLEVHLSFVFIMKKALVLIGYLATAYKSWQYSDRIYNILFKKHYKYPKILKLSLKKDISENDLFPITMVSKQIQKLTKSMLKSLKADLNLGDKQLMKYFIDSESGSLNKQELTKALQSLGLFEESDSNKNLIYQIITHNLTMKRIRSSSEKATFDIFEKIKLKWIDLVDLDKESSEFFIKRKDFSQELQAYDINTLGAFDQTLDDSEAPTKSIEEELMINKNPTAKISVELLKDAILAYAFEKQSVYSSQHSLYLHSKEMMEGEICKKSWRSFLKRNMLNLVQNSTKRLGYGLKYKISGDQIIFYGKLEKTIKKKTLVVQVIRKGGWILKELLIQAEPDYLEDNDQTTIENVQPEL